MNILRSFTIALTLFAALATTAEARSSCTLHSEAGYRGEQKNLNIPSRTYGSQSYSSLGVRWNGNNMRRYRGGALYGDVDSIIVRADEPVKVYVFSGDHFDGKVKVLSCRGGHCGFSVDHYRALDQLSVRSVICQVSGEEMGPTSPFEAVEIPMKDLAGPFSSMFDAGVEASRKVDGFREKRSYVKWTNNSARCSLYDWSFPCPTGWREQYLDMVHFHIDGVLDPHNWGWDYQVKVDIWVQPRVADEYRSQRNALQFRERSWRVWVERGQIRGRVKRGLTNGVRQLFTQHPTLGERITEGVYVAAGTQVLDAWLFTNEELADAGAPLLANVERIDAGFPCNPDRSWNYRANGRFRLGGSSADREQALCDSRFAPAPSSSLAPVLRLVK